MKAQTLKGFRDFLPEQARKRQYVIDTLRKVFESYGFEPLETPALEYEEVLLGKYGQEGDKLIYRFTDRGGRKVALRYDQTVPLARVVAQYGSASSSQAIPMPFKRYQIQPVWRAENPQKGRFREFLQCDIDIVGANSILSDIDILQCTNEALNKLGFQDFTILVNSRKIFEQFGANPKIISILDKEDKIGKDAVLKLLSEAIGSDDKAKDFYLSLKNSKPSGQLEQILKKGENLNLFYSPFLARGLDYYTDLIFEVKIATYKGGSVCGGGRYDNLIGLFSGQNIPAVGCAFGFDRLLEAMDQLDLFPKDLVTTQVLVTVFSMELESNSIQTVNKLRESGINAELWLEANTKLEKQLKYADRKGIPFVCIIGPDEEKNSTVVLKNMSSGTQQTVDVTSLSSKLQ